MARDLTQQGLVGVLAANLTESAAGPPDAIQPHGWMIVCDAGAIGVRRHSANLPDLFPAFPGPFIGARLREILGADIAHGLRNALSRFVTPAPPALLTGLHFPGCKGAFDIAVHATGDETVIEIERAPPEPDRALLDRLRASVARLAQAGDIDKLLPAAARVAFSMLQYDRVAVLRFDAGGQAVLVAEQKVQNLKSWTEGACPIEIFSEETRAQMLSSHLRSFVDAEAAPAQILAAPDAGKLDLSSAFLRAASPGERDMLRRCGAFAGLALALVTEGRLCGVILCCHRAQRHPSMDLRAAIELFGDFLSLQLQNLLQRRTMQDLAARRPAEVEGLRTMIVEDQALLAMDLESSLSERGIVVASVCASAAQALKALDDGAIDAAILDFHLEGETSLAVAEALERRGIPFVFVTGQAELDDPAILTRLAGKALTQKPYDIDRLMAALREVVQDRG